MKATIRKERNEQGKKITETFIRVNEKSFIKIETNDSDAFGDVKTSWYDTNFDCITDEMRELIPITEIDSVLTSYEEKLRKIKELLTSGNEKPSCNTATKIPKVYIAKTLDELEHEKNFSNFARMFLVEREGRKGNLSYVKDGYNMYLESLNLKPIETFSEFKKLFSDWCKQNDTIIKLDDSTYATFVNGECLNKRTKVNKSVGFIKKFVAENLKYSKSDTIELGLLYKLFLAKYNLCEWFCPFKIFEQILIPECKVKNIRANQTHLLDVKYVGPHISEYRHLSISQKRNGRSGISHNMPDTKISSDDGKLIIEMYKTKTAREIYEYFNGKYTFTQIKNFATMNRTFNKRNTDFVISDEILNKMKYTTLQNVARHFNVSTVTLSKKYNDGKQQDVSRKDRFAPVALNIVDYVNSHSDMTLDDIAHELLWSSKEEMIRFVKHFSGINING